MSPDAAAQGFFTENREPLNLTFPGLCPVKLLKGPKIFMETIMVMGSLHGHKNQQIIEASV